MLEDPREYMIERLEIEADNRHDLESARPFGEDLDEHGDFPDCFEQTE